jgi:hypothetical protein
MKRTTQLLMMMVLLAGACTKDPVQQVPPPTHNQISKVETDAGIVDITYNNDGSIHMFTRRQSNGPDLNNFVFNYENGRLVEVNFGGKWKYIYSGNLITSIETYNESGVLRYAVRFNYTNDKIVEKTSVLLSAAGEFPSFKTLYEYNADGNVSRKQLFSYINNMWLKDEEIVYVKYDHQVNTKEHLETYPYLPLTCFSVNNPLRENYLDANGQPVGLAVHEYEYDISGRPVSRKTTNSFIGYQDTYSISSFYY